MEETLSFEEMLQLLGRIYEQQMPFDRLLGIRIASLTATDVRVEIDMREELIGNFIRKILHGGVISSVLDLTGGLIASVELLKHLEGRPADEIVKRMARVGTIDLRVDYLRAGKGECFTASGSVLRHGTRVAVVRTELCNETQMLVAAGTGTYRVG